MLPHERDFFARLRKIAAQVPGMVFQMKQHPDGRRCFPFASEGVREVFRLAPEDIAESATKIWDIIHPEDADRAAQVIADSARTLTPFQCEFRVRFPDGAVRWLLGSASPESEEAGAVVWHGCVTDITERKHADEEHEHSRVLLQSVFSSVDLGVFVVDVTMGGDFRFVEVNPAYERLTGIPAQNIRGRSPRDLVPLISSEMAECLRTNFRRGAEASGPIEYEEPFFMQGRLLWWLTRLAPLRDSVGNVVRLVGRSLDITERKTIELRSQSLSERLQLATEAAQLGIWDQDLVQNHMMWDRRMLALYGMSADAFDGTVEAWRARVHPDDWPRVEQEQREAIDGKKSFNTSFRIVRPDDDVREVRACAHVQRNAAGRPVRMVGVNWDITAERSAQAEVMRARDEAENLNRQLEDALTRANLLAQEAAAATVAKSEFLANMSHEIRTPLNAVIGMSGILLGTPLSSEQREFAETIRSSGDGLLELLNDILDYSKIESGRLDLERRPFELRYCIESAIDLLAARATEKKLDLLYTIDPGVPDALKGDDTRLRQVLVNLLSNAVKFTSQGEVFLAVTLIAQDEGKARLRFATHDSGIGIPADRMDRLFRTFSQVDASTTRQYGGTGLGLAISKRIVELMGGRIWVESTAGQGSVFYFEVEVTVTGADTKPGLSVRVPTLNTRRVLIVDDNVTSGRVLSQQCVVWGLVPRAVTTAADALNLLASEAPFDLAIIDLEMPTQNGAELVTAIRGMPARARLPVVMLTSPGGQRVPDALSIAGFVNKPVKPAALLDAVMDSHQGTSNTRPPMTTSHVNLGEDHPLAILLAEDNPVNQRVALLMLQRLGYRADVAANGREAVAALTRQHYDLVLMDVQMPEMDGLTATRTIIERFAPAVRPRIVAMTANASVADREQCLAAGMDDFLAKPVRAVDLRRVIEQTPSRAEATAA